MLRRLAEIERTSMADFLVIPEDGGMPCFDLSAATPEQLAAIEGVQLDWGLEPGDMDEIAALADRIKANL